MRSGNKDNKGHRQQKDEKTLPDENDMAETPMTGTVLSHLALKFTTHPENLATEALGFVLGRSTDARAAMAGLAHQLGFVCPEGLSYRTQETNGDGARPDLVGFGSDETPHVVIEAKFWAGLTDAQPVGYLNNLSAEGGLLLFVAPAQRLDTLWSELLRRCVQAGRECTSKVSPMAEQRHVQIGNATLAAVSWRALLDVLAGALDRAGDRGGVADIQQLQGLCEKMDSDAFLPVHSEELTSALGRRMIQFGQLASDLVDVMVNRGDASVKGLRATGGNGWFGRYLYLRGYGGFLGCNSILWSQWGMSPLWIELKDPDWKSSPAVRTALADAEIDFKESDSSCCVPILLTTGVEREAVIDDALAQLSRITRALPSIDTKMTDLRV